jgi:Ca2+-transporting ATPase
MTVVDFYMYGVKEKQNGEENEKVQEIDQERALLVSAALCNDADITHEDKEIGDPTEVALLHFATERGVDYKNIRTSYDRLSELPFDSDRKLMSTVCSIQGDAIMFIKGAPDVILSRCSYGLDNGKLVKLSHEMRLAYKKQIEAFSDRALRVLAFAIKDVPDDGFVPCLEDEEDMTLIGLTAMIDPPRKEVYEAVASAKKAGIRPIMITGDHKTTAAAIAREIGIMREGDKALTGQELDALTEEELNKDLEKISVYARVSPENKIRIVKAWQQKGKVTAMTGDGVNDAPALKQADIGIGMGSGTDVAKDASAMVLTDDNFATIVTAVKIGRSVYSNIKKTITYLFAGNLGAILAILFAVFANLPSPFTALQLLFINLINDSLPAIALGLEPPEKNIMDYSPRETNEGILVGGTWQAIVSKGFVIAIVVVIAQYLGQKDSPQMGVAMAFTTVTLTRILQTLSARSNETPFIKLGLFSNLYVLGAMAVCFCLYGVVLLPGIREIFKIPVNFGVFAWLVCLGLSLLGLLGMECLKVGYNYKQRHDAR